jgi:hypothetical protein
MNSVTNRVFLGRRTLIALTLVMTYGGGFWLWLLHNVEGAVEPNEPPGVIHWLRDSSLSLPLVAIGVYLGAMLAERLLERHGRGASAPLVGAFVAVVLSLYASIVLSVGNPIHGWLFGGAVHGGGHDLPFALHVLRDGMLALVANEVLAVALVAILLGRYLLQDVRRIQSAA